VPGAVVGRLAANSFRKRRIGKHVDQYNTLYGQYEQELVGLSGEFSGRGASHTKTPAASHPRRRGTASSWSTKQDLAAAPLFTVQKALETELARA